jgi:predicted AAA+ superfamily ATPase
VSEVGVYERAVVKTLEQRLAEPRRFMQIVVGPRQTGKTTAVTQLLQRTSLPSRFASSDDAAVASREWLANEWELARRLTGPDRPPAVLVIDEVQKVAHWSAAVKSLWDEDSRRGVALHVVLTGSSAMLLQKGLDESLLGRFEVLYCPHWSLAECRDAFGYGLDDFLFFGGYPGVAGLREEPERWARYMGTSIVEPALSQDVLSMEEVRKPALLRALFRLGAAFSAQELSYTKLLGQLQDAGNTVTLAHYLELLGRANLLTGLARFSPDRVQQRKSSPRLLVYDTSLMTYAAGARRTRLLDDPTERGHLVETAVGAHLLARGREEGFDLFWWRDRDKEVDFVVERGGAVTGVEVKSGRTKSGAGGPEFLARFPGAVLLTVGAGDVTIEDFLLGTMPLFG